jgi:acetone carboxylase alpha subunit
VLIFSVLVHHPIKFIIKYWVNEPTVGVRDGDGLHPQRCALRQHPQHRPVDDPAGLPQGQAGLLGGANVHEGENGAIEPGGMPSMAKSRPTKASRCAPFKVGENYQIKRDI